VERPEQKPKNMVMKHSFCEHVVDILSQWGQVTYRPMFGGYGLYREGQIFALVCEDRLYLKTDKENKHLFETVASEPFTYEAKGKRATMSYWSAPEAFFESEDQAAYWAELAYRAGLRNAKS